MNTPLTDLQRELLSAHLDGELTAAERETVAALLTRADAVEYLDSLRATAALVSTHARVRAPVGLSGRVMGALEDELKPRAVGPGSEPFTSIPILSWRAPLFAAAAAIMVALAIMFGPALITPTAPEHEVARTELDSLPAENRRETPELYVIDEELKDLNEKSRAAGPSEQDDRYLRRTEGEWSGDANKRAGLDQPREGAPEPADEVAEDPAMKSGKESAESLGDARRARNGAASPAKAPESRPAPREDADEGDKPAGTKSDDLAESEKDDPKPEQERTRDGANDDSGAGVGGGNATGGTKKGHDEAPPSQPGANDSKDKAKTKTREEAKKEPGEEANSDAGTEDKEEGRQEEQGARPETVAISISDADSIAAQTDVLWVSNLYGDADLADDDSGNETVSVEIDVDKLPELLAALRKLAADQGYGEVDGAPATLGLVPERKQAQGITGYLPADEPEAPAMASPKPEAEAAPAKMRLTIRLK
jgi:negative regulator of sigma E activity